MISGDNELGVEGLKHLCEILSTNSSLTSMDHCLNENLFLIFWRSNSFSHSFFSFDKDGSPDCVWKRRIDMMLQRNKDFCLSENDAHKKFVGHTFAESFGDISICLTENDIDP